MLAFTFKQQIKFDYGYVVLEKLFFEFTPWNKQSHHFSQIKQIGHWQECVSLSQMTLWSRVVSFVSWKGIDRL